jgi:hypothetical protein
VSVDLEQDGDAVPGAAGDFSGGHPALSHREAAAPKIGSHSAPKIGHEKAQRPAL